MRESLLMTHGYTYKASTNMDHEHPSRGVFRAVPRRFLKTSTLHGKGPRRHVFRSVLARIGSRRGSTVDAVPCRCCGERDGKPPVLQSCRSPCRRHRKGVRTGRVLYGASLDRRSAQEWLDKVYIKCSTLISEVGAPERFKV